MPTFNPNSMTNGQSGDSTPKLPYFKIKDQERKIVRFIGLDDVNSWTFEYAHDISRLPSVVNQDVKWKYVKAKCAGADCPICKLNESTSGKKGVTTQAFVMMLVYDQMSGQATPMVWLRTSNFYQNLYSLAADYSPLSNYIFIVSRQGTKLDTTYSIVPAPAERYPAAQYPMDLTVFSAYDTDPANYMLNYTVEELNSLVTAGNARPQAVSAQGTFIPTAPAYANVPVPAAPIPQSTPVAQQQFIQTPAVPVAPAVTAPVTPAITTPTNASTAVPASFTDTAQSAIPMPSWMTVDTTAGEELPFTGGIPGLN